MLEGFLWFLKSDVRLFLERETEDANKVVSIAILVKDRLSVEYNEVDIKSEDVSEILNAIEITRDARNVLSFQREGEELMNISGRQLDKLAHLLRKFVHSREAQENTLEEKGEINT